ncbi:protein of unknown function [Salinibacillus kushneri]|uniref:DUF4349 domain-containing protein n=1 Tax=Salinibacillus kushneri TaxID=237682 RepID=A0A1I0DMJ0_9BACI|nr:DUF4349 domain-containing protein [Salinibacillus kushneri]SET33733.1 protein of unknown function [Salinibacillus kushneri]
MKKTTYFLFILCLFLLGACNSEDTGETETKQQADSAADIAKNTEKMEIVNEESTEENAVNQSKDSTKEELMIMYHAYFTLKIKDVKHAIDTITNRTNELNGYVVETSSTNREKQLHSRIIVRIPNQNLQSFMKEIENRSEKVVERQVTGEDVTEEYTDLESRLKAKKTVEARLLDFMKSAEKTEDLLHISEDLAQVQEKIEQIEGRMKFLDNRTEYAEVNISLEDVSVDVPGIAEKDLQTGERIKRAFTNSLNQLSSICSGIFVFLIGYSPFLIILFIIGGTLWLLKRRKNNKDHS